MSSDWCPKAELMTRYFARVVRALIVSSLGFGGGIFLFAFILALTHGVVHALRYGLTAGVFFGSVFSILLVCVLLPLDLSAHVFLAKGLYKEIWELEQCRTVVAEGSLKDVFGANRQALLVVPFVTSVSDDAENMIARAVTGASWRSPGEELEVEIKRIADNKWGLRCISRCRSSRIVFDYGKNFENVETWMRELGTMIKTSETPQLPTGSAAESAVAEPPAGAGSEPQEPQTTD